MLKSGPIHPNMCIYKTRHHYDIMSIVEAEQTAVLEEGAGLPKMVTSLFWEEA